MIFNEHHLFGFIWQLISEHQNTLSNDFEHCRKSIMRSKILVSEWQDYSVSLGRNAIVPVIPYNWKAINCHYSDRFAFVMLFHSAFGVCFNCLLYALVPRKLFRLFYFIYNEYPIAKWIMDFIWFSLAIKGSRKDNCRVWEVSGSKKRSLCYFLMFNHHYHGISFQKVRKRFNS